MPHNLLGPTELPLLPLPTACAVDLSRRERWQKHIRQVGRFQRFRGPANETDIESRWWLRGEVETEGLGVSLEDGKTDVSLNTSLATPTLNEGTEATAEFELPRRFEQTTSHVDQLQFYVDEGAELYVDDILIFEPGVK